jgi:3-methyl-2-oxobutanoate hydroxymethyltransferase
MSGNTKLLMNNLKEMKLKREKISMVTAYSYPQAQMAEEAGIDILLVGDSLGMVELGYSDTVPVTMEDMLIHIKAVRRGAPDTHVLGDMPFMSYNISIQQAVENAGILYQKGRADSVKFEGGTDYAETVRAVFKAGIPVCGHIGLTPQTASLLGGHKVQGKSLDAAKKMIDDAIALDEAGAYAIVLEAIPAGLAEIITEKVSVPTIGIGAGSSCDGQVLVFHDMLGMYKKFTPKFVKVYADVYSQSVKALSEYSSEVKEGSFPGKEHSFKIKEETLDQLKSLLG